MNADVAKGMWRGYMGSDNHEQADAWYERLNNIEKEMLSASPMVITALARKGQEEMTPYEQYRAGYIKREEWAKMMLPEPVKEKRRRGAEWADYVIMWSVITLLVTEVVRLVVGW